MFVEMVVYSGVFMAMAMVCCEILLGCVDTEEWRWGCRERAAGHCIRRDVR